MNDNLFVWLWLVVLAVFVIVICLICYCWKRRIDERLDQLGLQERTLPERSSLQVNETETGCGWCRYWWGDRGALPVDQNAMRPSELNEMADELGELHQMQSHRSYSNRSNSIESAKYSPRLSRSSRSLSKSPGDNLPIHAGGRRLSHDPFLLCQDLQTIEIRRKSVLFEQRRKSEQVLPSYDAKRKSVSNS